MPYTVDRPVRRVGRFVSLAITCELQVARLLRRREHVTQSRRGCLLRYKSLLHCRLLPSSSSHQHHTPATWSDNAAIVHTFAIITLIHNRLALRRHYFDPTAENKELFTNRRKLTLVKAMQSQVMRAEAMQAQYQAEMDHQSG